MDSPHLLVPIKVQALVIDDIVITKSGAVEYEPNKFAANAGRWAPQLSDYQTLLVGLTSPGPKPFYGATRTYQTHQADQLVPDESSNVLPEDKDRGVYLHWVLPSGLRHAYTPGLLDFPALPEHWLIVRFARTGATLKTSAWFVDGGSLATDAGPANLLFAGTEKYVATSVGKVVPLDKFASTNFSGQRTTITAIGNTQTGSPTFTAFIAENRNVFSWHDKLEDLRQPNEEGTVAAGTTLSYMLLGWYHDQTNEPLASPAAKLIEQRDATDKLTGVLIDPPGLLIDTATAIPDLKQRRSVFHGICAHINYWSPGAYQGPMLGYPGSPRVEGSIGKATPAFQVGIGNSAEDALVSLVSSSYSGEQEAGMEKVAPNLWKAMEAVIYRQPETLIRSWNASPRDNIVHQHWFSTRDAGKLWSIRPKENNDGVFPAEADKTAAQTKAKPTPEQLAELKRLNGLQAEADAVSHELTALQQELYGRWWTLCSKSRKLRAPVTAEARDVSEVAGRVEPLRTRRDQLLGQLGTLLDQLSKKLPSELELKHDAAQRFWSPADPVLVVKNCGRVTKHQSPRQLPCRLPEQIITTAEVLLNQNTNQDTKTFNQPFGVAEIAAAAKQHLPACPTIVGALLDEGSIVEQAINDLVARSLPERKQFDTADDWQSWVDRLTNDLTWDGKRETFPTDRVSFGKPGALDIKPQRVVELWGRQPWSPLFLDWQITWFPTPELPSTNDGFGPNWPLRGFDYVPPDKNSIPAKGWTIRGRSLLTPIDGRIFDEPLQTLHELLQAKRIGARSPFPEAVVDVLSRFEIVWDKTLGELQRAGLMGQELTGFHQALLRHDVSLPRVTPDPARPWIENKDQKKLEAEVVKNLEPPDKEGLGGERLSPPLPAPPTTAPASFPFSLIRAGALRIDELWLVDDFGQSADLLGLTQARSTSAGQIFHPRMRWHDDRDFIAMPPRVLQPARLNFAFTNTGDASDGSDPALSPISGWLFYNRLDQALVLCERTGDLVGQLLVTKEQDKLRISWDTDPGGVPLEKIPNEALKRFARSFIETSATPKLLDLLNLIDRSLDRIRPAAARNSALAGRPLALMNAAIGLELFGKAWTDPHKTGTKPLAGTGDAALDALSVRVNLGCRQNVEDGLVGYFRGNDYNHIIPGELPDKVTATAYISDPKNNPLRVGFTAPEKLTLLMDPWGSVQAACGLVPAKSIALAHPELDKTVAQMETSFRVGPVLIQAGKIVLPTPTGEKGKWNFYGPLTDQSVTAVAPFDPKSLSDQTVVATEGRLLLVNEE